MTPDPIQEGQQSLEENVLSEGWGWLLALGIIFIILGILALGAPSAVSMSVELVLGWILIIGGVISIISSFFSGQWGKFFLILLSGIIFLIAGIELLAHPLAGVLTITLFLAVFFFVEGIFKIIFSFQMKSSQNWGWVLFSGIISLFLAILIWAEWPASIGIIGLLVGFYILFSGISMVMLAFGARNVPQQA